MSEFYDDSSYGTNKLMRLRGIAAQTSVIAADTVVERRTMMEACTVKDWNVVVKTGDVLTGTADAASWRVAIGKSAAGTGAVAGIGTAKLSALAMGGTYGDNTVVDASCTETNFSAGDDLVFYHIAGTALPAGSVRLEADVMYTERYT